MTVFTRREALATGLALAASTGLPAWAQQKPRGGTLIMGLEGEPTSLTAHLATDTVALMIASNLLSSLIETDFNYNPTPDLAERWDFAADGLTYTFYLNQRATWHDGKPVTAEDVEFTFNEVIAKAHPRAGTWWPNVESAKATAPHTFVIKLKTPYAPFVTLLANSLASGAMILPKHVYQGTDPKTNPANLKPIGSGPFKFVNWVKGQHIEMVRNENYFKPGKPYLDRVIAQVVPDPGSRMLAFERGDIDFLHWYIVPHSEVARLRKDKRFEIVPRGGESAATTGYMLYNVRNEPLKDKRVRQAIAYAIDRTDIMDKAFFGEGKVANSPVNSGLTWCFTDKYDAYAKPDVAKANALLDEAGMRRGADGKRMTLRLFWASGRDYEGRASELVRDQLRAVGIDARVQMFDRATFIDRTFIQWDFDLAMQLFATGPDPTIGLTPRFHTNQIRKAPFVNGMGYSNPALDRLFDTEFKEVDRTKRAAMWGDIQRILMDEVPALPLFEMPIVMAVNAKIKDVITNPVGYVQSRENTYVVR